MRPTGSAAPAFARLAVCDNGPGVDEWVQRRAFEPFFTTKGPGEGTGLGLSISWRLIRAAGGTLECDGLGTPGARFSVYLPLVASRDAATATRTP